MTTLHDQDIERVLDATARLRGLSFHDYALTATSKGVAARLLATRSPNVDAYLALLTADATEVNALVDALVVPYTGFFRDPVVFTALAQTVIPSLESKIAKGRPLRAWSMGSSTGEETWSLAMLLAARGLDFDLLGTDVSDAALSSARNATYLPQLCDAIPEALRQRFVRKAGDLLSIAPELREHVRFAAHDMLGARAAPPEAVIASFDLVLLRNVLIYFDRRLQEKALERVVEALQPHGVLGLGKYETIPASLVGRLRPFEGLDARLRIFQLGRA